MSLAACFWMLPISKRHVKRDLRVVGTQKCSKQNYSNGQCRTDPSSSLSHWLTRIWPIKDSILSIILKICFIKNNRNIVSSDLSTLKTFQFWHDAHLSFKLNIIRDGLIVLRKEEAKNAMNRVILFPGVFDRNFPSYCYLMERKTRELYLNISIMRLQPIVYHPLSPSSPY